jgi:predicted nucleic acid-binding Zn ribbon protein
MPIAERIACMECGGEAQLVQPIEDDDVLEVGDVLVYRCPDCLQRWDVVVDEEDLTDTGEADM